MGPDPSNVTDDESNYGFSFPIVAIGASAGGLHPLQCFISALPKEFGFLVVFMQHLSTAHKSLLAELLGKARPDLVFYFNWDLYKIHPSVYYKNYPSMLPVVPSNLLRAASPIISS
ncbi:MAG: chemotaxis protein CheB [Thermodesulfovibrionales bacterium]